LAFIRAKIHLFSDNKKAPVSHRRDQRLDHCRSPFSGYAPENEGLSLPVSFLSLCNEDNSPRDAIL